MWQLSLASHRAGTWLRGAPATRPRVVKRQSGTHATWAAQRTKGCPCTPAADSNPALLAGHPHVPQPSGQWCPSLKVPGPQAGQCPDRWQVPAQTSAHVPGVAWGPLARRLYLLPHPCPARSLEEVPMSFRCQGAHGGVGGGGSPPSAVWQPNPTTLGWHHLPPPGGGGMSAPNRQAHCCPGQGIFPSKSWCQLTGLLAAAARARTRQSHLRALGPGPRCCQVARLTLHIVHPFLRH